jgi:histone acetyltransferase (RNA polymerase elongator complex component)
MRHNNIAFFIPHIGCPNKCSFCNQHTISSTILPPTLEHIEQTLKVAFKQIEDKSNTEIAFFGGSFTGLDIEYMTSLLKVASRFIGNDKFGGIRISTRPDLINPKILSLLKAYNVTSIELGVQSLDDEVLKANMRGHSVADADIAIKQIKQSGFNLGLQIMVGLYKDTTQKLFNTAKKVIEYSPDTLRIYPTIILPDTMLYDLYKNNQYSPISLGQAINDTCKIILMMKNANIKIIRVGLHASEIIESCMIKGAYHPAFKELCDNEIYLNNALALLKGTKNKNIILQVNSKNISKMVGQKRKNIDFLKNMGFNIIVKPNDNLLEYEINMKGSF